MAYKQEEIEKIFTEIIDLISKDGLPIRKILKNKSMPSTETFFRWLDEDSEKSKRYARACEARADAIFEEIIVIADDQEKDIYEDKDGNEQINHNVIQRSRLRVDARKWAVSKMHPKKYSDKLDLTSKGESLNKELDYSKLSNEELVLMHELKKKASSSE